MIVLVALAIIVYIKREGLKRAVIAFGVYHTRVFTPPPMRGELAWRGLIESAQFYWDFAGFAMARDRRLKEFTPLLRPLVKEIVHRQSTGEGMQYSMHICREIRWLMNFTPDAGKTQAQIAGLGRSLTLPQAEQHLTTEQQASDGSWGLGFTSWYFRLYYSVDHVEHCRAQPRYPFSFLGRINSPEKLTAVLNSDLMDNFTKTGVFNEDKLNETFSALARILLRAYP